MISLTRQHSDYRSRDEIIYELLSVAKAYENRGGASRIKLLYTSRLSNDQLKYYLQQLLTYELLTIDKTSSKEVIWKDKKITKGQVYHLTDKGAKYLDMMDDLKKQIGPGLHI